MSVEDEKKKPRKAPAKNATTASSKVVAGEKKVKAASAKSSPAKQAAKVVPQEPVQQHSAGQEPGQVEHAQQTAAPVAGRREPTRVEITELAYAYFVERGRQHGFHEHDWYRAERELRMKLS